MMKMTAKEKRMTALISLGAGICVFAGAAFANYTTSGGYSVYKKAIIGALGEENYTLNADVSLKIDGKEISSGNTKEMFSEKGDANLYKESTSVYYDGTESSYKTYMQDNISIQIYDDGEAQVMDGERSKQRYNPKNGSSLNGGIDMDRETDQKMVRFVELLADTFMGDLKNNFVYVSGDDNSKKYELTLDGMQVPEFVNAGLSAAFSSMSNNEYNQDDPTLALGKDPVVRSASTIFTVDNEGRLLHNDLRAELIGKGRDGAEHSLVLDISINMSDYGTTTPPKADLENLKISYQESKDANSVDYDVEDGVTITKEIDADGNVRVVFPEEAEVVE